MNAIELKRAEFRHYLEISGVMDALSRALIKLYDEPTKPDNPVAFVRQNFLCDAEPTVTVNIASAKPKKPSEAGIVGDGLIQSLHDELDAARQEIRVLQQALDNMQASSDPKLCSLPNDPAEDITTATLQVQSIADEHSFDQMVAELFNDSAESLLLKHLSKELYSSLLDVKTEPFESTLLDCIRCYTRNKVGRPDIGLFATDSDCYNKFVGLFGSIVDELYAVDATVVQPQCEWGDATQLGFLDPNACNIQWIKVVCRRSIDGELFTPRTSELQLNEILDKVKLAAKLDDSEHVQLMSIDELTADDEWLTHLTIGEFEQQSFWPRGRAVLAHKDKNFATLVNFEDHVTFVSVQRDGNFAAAYQRIIDEATKIACDLPFARHERFGWLTVCPSNIGASIHAVVALKLSNTRRLAEICDKYDLRCDGDEADTVTISNRSAFACTEYECIKRVWDGVAKIISEQLLPLDEETADKAPVDEEAVATVAETELVVNTQAENEVVDVDEASKIDDASFVISRDEAEEQAEATADDVQEKEESDEPTEVDPTPPEAPDPEEEHPIEPEAAAEPSCSPNAIDDTAEEAIEA